MGTHGVKVVIIYPRPQDEQAFEKAILREHVPMVENKLRALRGWCLTKVTGSPQGKIAAYRIAEVYFSSMDDLQTCIESDGGKEVIAHAQNLQRRPAPHTDLRRGVVRLLVVEADGMRLRLLLALASSGGTVAEWPGMARAGSRRFHGVRSAGSR